MKRKAKAKNETTERDGKEYQYPTMKFNTEITFVSLNLHTDYTDYTDYTDSLMYLVTRLGVVNIAGHTLGLELLLPRLGRSQFLLQHPRPVLGFQKHGSFLIERLLHSLQRELHLEEVHNSVHHVPVPVPVLVLSASAELKHVCNPPPPSNLVHPYMGPTL